MKRVYVMEAENRLKIGVAGNVEKRAEQLKIGCPSIRIIYESEPLSNAVRVERILHDEYRDMALGHEWFSGVDKNWVIAKAMNVVAAYGVREENKADDGADKVSKIIHALFGEVEEEVQQVESEIEEINCEINKLKEQMIDVGFSCEEIQKIINNAEKEFANNTKALTA